MAGLSARTPTCQQREQIGHTDNCVAVDIPRAGRSIKEVRRTGLGAGEIVFLSDFNTFDNDMLNDLDNQTLWLNLFEYPVCRADLDGDGSVGVSDLLSLLASWGPCKGCPADFDNNGTVGASDLLALLANWGPCL